MFLQESRIRRGGGVSINCSASPLFFHDMFRRQVFRKATHVTGRFIERLSLM
jgi:hypothetical protein